MSNSKLSVQVERKKGDSGDQREKGDLLIKPKPPCFFEITLNNRSSVSLNGIQVNYCIYRITEDCVDDKDSVSVVEGTQDGITLGPRETFVLKTEEATQNVVLKKQVDRYTDELGVLMVDVSHNKVSEDDIEGVLIKLAIKMDSGNTFHREVRYPTSLNVAQN